MVRFFTLERSRVCVWNMAWKEKSLEAGKPEKKCFSSLFFIQKNLSRQNGISLHETDNSRAALVEVRVQDQGPCLFGLLSGPQWYLRPFYKILREMLCDTVLRRQQGKCRWETSKSRTVDRSNPGDGPAEEAPRNNCRVWLGELLA